MIIGNNDAHGKNFSLLYQGQQTRLAPFYNMISTVYYPALAMKIDTKYDFDGLFPRHIEQMAKEAGLAVALVLKEAISMLDKIQTYITDSPFTATILQRVGTLNQRFRKI